MTPKFTTQCYVRIEDAKKQKEVCEMLEQMGYDVFIAINNPFGDTIFTDLFFADGSYTNEPCYAIWKNHMVTAQLPNTHINCGTNLALFFSLAGMREDTDSGQFFIANKDTEAPPLIWGEMFRCNKEKCDGFVFQDPRPRGKEYFIGMGLVRRATATEIINYHKQKGE